MWWSTMAVSLWFNAMALHQGVSKVSKNTCKKCLVFPLSLSGGCFTEVEQHLSVTHSHEHIFVFIFLNFPTTSLRCMVSVPFTGPSLWIHTDSKACFSLHASCHQRDLQDLNWDMDDDIPNATFAVDGCCLVGICGIIQFTLNLPQLC